MNHITIIKYSIKFIKYHTASCITSAVYLLPSCMQSRFRIIYLFGFEDLCDGFLGDGESLFLLKMFSVVIKHCRCFMT